MSSSTPPLRQPVSCIMFLSCLFGCSQSPTPPASTQFAPLSNIKTSLKSSDFTVATNTAQLNEDAFQAADLRILFVGNSHTLICPSFLGQLLSKNHPKFEVVIARSGSGFLVDHMTNETTLNLIDYGKWDFVFLQAQKYSTSGKYSYPIDGALALANRAQSKGAQVIMYPEWSRREAPDEYKRINAIHNEIAELTGAKVAPVGQTWSQVMEKFPDLSLYHADGNHASNDGHFVNACVFYWVIANSLNANNELDSKWSETSFSNPIESQLFTSIQAYIKPPAAPATNT